jgi:DNA-binding NtrC family response regulator
MMNRNIHILIVDDDAMIRDCMTAFLEDEGFTVQAASSAEDALRSIAALKPVVCITDMRLPGMSGELFILNANSACPGTHFMIHTGSSYILTDELRDIGMAFDDVMLKPVHDLTLLSKRIVAIAKGGTPL